MCQNVPLLSKRGRETALRVDMTKQFSALRNTTYDCATHSTDCSCGAPCSVTPREADRPDRQAACVATCELVRPGPHMRDSR
eukprot:scaffold2800_cov135-Isochrysis_galbana.AAC.4